jgi:site-specific recombinase XerD
MLAWIEAAGVERGPLFRKVNRHGRLEGTRLSGYSVAMIVKRTINEAGINPANFAGHSLRASFCANLPEAGRIARIARG